ncbi:hypothetical protein BS78_03G416200 [Paspalum vaginatum]|nr:hypothetical protein BS78_03G416200 [Paspalum vaginatum]
MGRRRRAPRAMAHILVEHPARSSAARACASSLRSALSRTTAASTRRRTSSSCPASGAGQAAGGVRDAAPGPDPRLRRRPRRQPAGARRRPGGTGAPVAWRVVGNCRGSATTRCRTPATCSRSPKAWQTASSSPSCSATPTTPTS